MPSVDMRSFKVLCPADLMMLLHYNGMVDDYRDADEEIPIVASSLSKFLEAGVIKENEEGPNPKYKITEKGLFYVDALCKMPFPVSKWEIPE